MSLWVNWLKSGYAPNSVLNNTQTTSWQEFATGQFAFAENGTWQLANVPKLGFGYGIVPIPAQNGGTAPVPTGGEFITVPVQHDTSRYQTRFRTVGVHNGRKWSTDSLLDLMPITLGEHLSEHIASALVERLTPHLTRYGLASQLPSSPHYQPDGYWRGPTWSPSTVLVVDGLRRAGQGELAARISGGSARCARHRDLRRTSTRSPEPACATASTPGPRVPTSFSPGPMRWAKIPGVS